MTISSSTNRVQFLGNDATTVFTYSFVMASADYAVVIYVDADQNLTVLSPNQYGLTLNAAAPGQIWGIGGTLTYPLSGSPIPSGSTITLLREIPDVQLTVLLDQGNFNASVVEGALDYEMMAVQQWAEAVNRAIVINPADPPVFNLILPVAAQRADTILGFDANGAISLQTITGGGTVGAIGLSLPAQFQVSGSPTSGGTITATWSTQGANVVFAGPTSGGTATPAFRALVAADLPAGSATALGALLITNNLSELTASASTARTNLGLGVAAVKGVSRTASTTLASVSGTFTLGHIAVFSDTSGTIADGGAPATGSGTVTNITASTNLTGGTITTSGTIAVIANPTFAGIVTTGSGRVVKTRYVTASGAVTVATTDNEIFINKTVGASTTVNLMATPTTGTKLKIKDAKGDAATNAITVTPNSGTIDGAASVTMSTNYQAIELTYNSVEWSVV